VTLNCHIEAYPPPMDYWMREDNVTFIENNQLAVHDGVSANGETRERDYVVTHQVLPKKYISPFIFFFIFAFHRYFRSWASQTCAGKFKQFKPFPF
jgi:hypothetical protein